MDHKRITSPFNSKSTALEVVSGYDLKGKIALVTGGASGIGIETVKALASAGAEVVVAVRDLSKAEKAIKEIGFKNITVREIDLSDLHSVRKFAVNFSKDYKELHILVNNAGIMAVPEKTVTPEGYELQFATNHLGHFLLTKLLMPLLESAKKARIVSLSSVGHQLSSINLDDINFEKRPYDTYTAYGQSKTANALFAVGLNERYAHKGITANAVHPGGIMTGLQKHMTQEQMQMAGWIDKDGNINSNFKTTEQGAATTVWAAVGKELDGSGGRYLENCGEAMICEDSKLSGGVKHYALDKDLANKLWELSEKMVTNPTFRI